MLNMPLTTREKSMLPNPAFEPLHDDLPVFRAQTPDYALFYAPGCVVVADHGVADALAESIRSDAPVDQWVIALRRQAESALHDWERQITAPFAPECLTLYLYNQCNLRCTYCYTGPEHQPDTRLDRAAIGAAAEQVAAHCQAAGLPFTVVMHGGGEPTLYQDELDAALAVVDQVAQRYGLAQFRYIATNGMLSEARVGWLVDHFDLIGLSCDGPPQIHDRQRPAAGGQGSSAAVARTAALLRRAGKPFHVRATITPETFAQQPDIAAYICRELAPQEIHFEPVYMGGKTAADGAFAVSAAQAFVTHFLAAQAVAQEYGIPLSCSGSRVGAIHGAYCNVFRGVVNLVPPGMATACFKLTGEQAVREAGAVMGAFDPAEQRFTLDVPQIHSLRQILSTLPETCTDCFNRFHCTRGCPDHCPLEASAGETAPGFRCELQKRLATHTIRAAADRLWHHRMESEHAILGTTG